jgi:6-phosphofructokinase
MSGGDALKIGGAIRAVLRTGLKHGLDVWCVFSAHTNLYAAASAIKCRDCAINFDWRGNHVY